MYRGRSFWLFLLVAFSAAWLSCAAPAVAASGPDASVLVTPRRVTPAAPVPNAAIGASAAARHVGEHATVCDRVAAVYTARRSRSRPTFLDFGRDYPNETFTAVIFERARERFGELADLRGREVCVTGLIERYRGKPEMILESPGQLRAK